MTNREFKVHLVNALKQRNIFTQQTSHTEIRTRCPFCGDSRKNKNTGHLYIKINPNDDTAIVYNCFKCPASGVLTYSDLELLGIEGNFYKTSLDTLNKTSTKPSNTNDEPDKYFDYKIPTAKDYKKIKYVQDRLGYNFTIEELRNIKIITSFKDFLILNKLDTIYCKPYMAHMIEDHYVGFLSSNGSHILFRDITDEEEIRWYKYPISEDSRGQKVFYSVKSDIDLYTKEHITINLSEGVLDALSIAYNLNNNFDNILNIAVCGKYYTRIIKDLISSGFVGSNITINIYSDRDGSEDTSPEYFKKILHKYTYLVKEINLYYNLLHKDCGVPKERIKLKKYTI